MSWRDKIIVHPGGLMRCCLATLEEATKAAQEPPKEGDVLPCKYHSDNGGMIYRDNAWRWNQPEERDYARHV